MSTTRFLLPLMLVLATCWASNIPIFGNVPPLFIQEDTDNLPDFKLPSNIKPLEYDIQLTPILDVKEKNKFTFTGTSIITLSVVNATNKIVFHAKDLDINSYVFDNIGPQKELITVKECINDTQRDFKMLILEKDLIKDTKIKLILTYSGNLTDELRGFYRSSYKNPKGETIWLATTHFEPTGARRAFPCWDEPALKAKFTITIVVPKNYNAISNMPQNEKLTTGQTKVFQTTPEMSTYLVAFVVSQFANKTNDEETFSVWAKPQAINDAGYALDFGEKVSKALETYTGVEYAKHQKMPQLDQVAIPQLEAGAMENWGLITYREPLLLYTKDKTTTEQKQGTALVIAHEFSHQWFGNLVTCEWWDYIWLNEGFATFFQYFIADEVTRSNKETWRLMEQFVVKTLQASAFVADARDKTRALNPTISVKTPDQIGGLFDDIAYKKGASIIRMMQQFLRADVLQKGFNQYLMDNKFKSVNSDDLFNAIEKAGGNNVTDFLPKDLSLVDVMNNWVNKPGYPVVTVSKNKSIITLTQERFYQIKPINQDKSEWYIPIDYVTEDAPNDVEGVLWLEPKKSLSYKVEKLEDKWILVNKDQVGYYRVNYDNNNWGQLSAYLKKKDSYQNISAVNRAQLIDDAFNLARAGDVDYDVALGITSYLDYETDYIPWCAAIKAFDDLDSVMQDEKEEYHKYVARKVTEFAKTVRYFDQENGTHVDRLAKVLAMDAACKYGVEECNKYVETELNAWLQEKKDKENEKILAPDLRSGILRAALRNANQDTFNKVLNKYKDSSDEEEKADILAGLGCVASDEIARGFLASTIKKEPDANVFDAMNSICECNAASFDIIMEFINEHIKDIEKASPDNKGWVALLPKLINRITKADQSLEMWIFLTKLHLSSEEYGSVYEGGNGMEKVKWIKSYHPKVAKWIKESNKQENKPDSASSFTVTMFLVIIPVLLARLY